jgi:hypothetical protein
MLRSLEIILLHPERGSDRFPHGGCKQLSIGRSLLHHCRVQSLSSYDAFSARLILLDEACHGVFTRGSDRVDDVEQRNRGQGEV